jgi:hypothetical protein
MLLADLLAALYLHQGRYDDADPLLNRSQPIREKALGPNHPDVALSLSNLGALYVNQQGRDANVYGFKACRCS